MEDTARALCIEDLQSRSIFSLSGGQKQLLAFGSVYAMGPKIYVLDEPTANLDPDAIARLHDQIAYLKSQGHTVIIAEHRLYFLTDLIDRAVYLRDGVVEHIFSRKQFQALTGQERESLGLRALTPAACDLPVVEPAGAGEGLSVEGLTCAYPKEAPVFRGLSFFRPSRNGSGCYRSQWGGQDHAFALPVRTAAGAGRTDPAGRPAIEKKRSAASGLPGHAGCKSSAFLRQCVGRMPDVRAGCAG